MDIDLGTNAEPIVLDSSADHTTGRELIVVGAGGHGRELVDIVRACSTGSTFTGVVDDGNPDSARLERASIPHLGTSASLEGRDVEILIGIGYPHIRRAVAERLNLPTAAAVMHPLATAGTDVIIGDGSVLAQRSVLTTNVRLGQHTHIGVGATVSHDCEVGSFVTLCPGSHLAGDAVVEDDVFVGIGATVLPGVRIGRGATIGAGAVVTTNVARTETVAGVPAYVLPDR